MAAQPIAAAPSRQRPPAAAQASVVIQFWLLTRRSIVDTLRRPVAWIPNLAISAFFLFIYNASLSKISALPAFGGASYLGFIIPVSIVSGAIGGAGGAGAALVRDLESGYFQKLLLTPVNRAALIAGPIIAGALQLAVATIIIILIGLGLGLHPATGPAGLGVVLGLAVLWGLAFAGYSVAIALRTKNAQATQSATFIFFPLIFLSDTFVPLSALGQEWLKVAARLNPTTYVFDAMRAVLLHGWQADTILEGLAAVAVSCAITFTFALLSASSATRQP